MEHHQADVLVFSDGSGHVDGFGGWAAIAVTPDRIWKTFRWGAVAGTTVDRMEMTAMLEGLQMAFEMATLLPKQSLKSFLPKVHIISDRESMVLSIKNVYARSNAEDLWNRFKFFEEHMKITAELISRETDYAEFVTVDLHASSARIVAKKYYESLDNLFPMEIKLC